MRTTLALDPDVAALLTRARKLRGASLKRVVNDALRAGLEPMTSTPVARRPFRTATADLGGCRLGSLDDVAEVLELAEEAPPS